MPLRGPLMRCAHVSGKKNLRGVEGSLPSDGRLGGGGSGAGDISAIDRSSGGSREEGEEGADFTHW